MSGEYEQCELVPECFESPNGFSVEEGERNVTDWTGVYDWKFGDVHNIIITSLLIM